MATQSLSQAPWLNSLHGVAVTVALLEEAGIDVNEVLSGSDISTEDLSQLQRFITPAQEQLVFANAQRLAPQAAFGITLGLRMHISVYGVLGYALLSAASFGEALRVALQYPVLLGTYFRLDQVEESGQIWIIASQYREQESLREFNIELCLGSLKVAFEDILRCNLPLKAVSLDYSDKGGLAEAYEQAFGCDVTFKSDRNGICFDSQLLDQRLPLADPVTHKEMLIHCSRQNSQYAAQRAWMERLRERLALNLKTPPGIEELARQMNCSSRSLRRHLANQGASYQQILDELRYTKAIELLQLGRMSIFQIAESLGYSETSGFRHAFLRWSGQPPSRFRR